MMQPDKQPLILAIITDLFFTSRVQGAATALACRLAWIDTLTDHSDQGFLRFLRDQAPSLIVLDLSTPKPWKAWLLAAKSDPHTAAIPWLAFGSHVAADLLKGAKDAGADKVLAKSALVKDLPQLLQTWASPRQ